MNTWILLRGLTRGSRHWMHFTTQLHTHFPEDNIITLDLPGNSQHYQSTSPYSIDKAVKAYRRQLSLIPDKPSSYHIIGLSMGGMVALSWLAHYPKEVAHIWMINSSIGHYSPAWQRIRPTAVAQLAASLWRNSKTRERIIQRLTLSLKADDASILASWHRYAVQQPTKRHNALRQLWAAATFRCPQCPNANKITLLASQHDNLTNVRCSQTMAQQWQLSLFIHSSAGHDIPVDDADWVIEHLKR